MNPSSQITYIARIHILVEKITLSDEILRCEDIICSVLLSYVNDLPPKIYATIWFIMMQIAPITYYFHNHMPFLIVLGKRM